MSLNNDSGVKSSVECLHHHWPPIQDVERARHLSFLSVECVIRKLPVSAPCQAIHTTDLKKTRRCTKNPSKEAIAVTFYRGATCAKEFFEPFLAHILLSIMPFNSLTMEPGAANHRQLYLLSASEIGDTGTIRHCSRRQALDRLVSGGYATATGGYRFRLKML